MSSKCQSVFNGQRCELRQRRLKDMHVLDPFLSFQVHPLNPVVLLGKKGKKALKRGEWPCLERKA